MKLYRTQKLYWITGIIILSFWGCSTLQITHTWIDEELQPKKYNKILVLGISDEKNMKSLEQIEIHMAGDLRFLGYSAVPAIKEYGFSEFRGMNEETLTNKLQTNGFDAVVIVFLLDREKEKNDVPDPGHRSSHFLYQSRLWTYYSTMYTRVSTPGYYTGNASYFWEADLYDIPGKKLIYSGQTNSFDPGSSDLLGHEYARLIVKDMVRTNVLPKPELISVK
jgi:hypothetical protein